MMLGNFKQVLICNIESNIFHLGALFVSAVLLSNEKMVGGSHCFRQVITDVYMGHAKKCYAVMLFSSIITIVRHKNSKLNRGL